MMQKVTRFFFGVADVALALMLLSGVVSLMRIFFAFLDLTFPGGGGEGKQVLDVVLAMMGLPALTKLSLLLLALAALFTLAYMFSYVLLMSKQVFGLFIMIGLDLVGFVLWQFDPVITILAGVRWLILGLPWLLTWIDLKRRGTLT